MNVGVRASRGTRFNPRRGAARTFSPLGILVGGRCVRRGPSGGRGGSSLPGKASVGVCGWREVFGRKKAPRADACGGAKGSPDGGAPASRSCPARWATILQREIAKLRRRSEDRRCFLAERANWRGPKNAPLATGTRRARDLARAGGVEGYEEQAPDPGNAPVCDTPPLAPKPARRNERSGKCEELGFGEKKPYPIWTPPPHPKSDDFHSFGHIFPTTAPFRTPLRGVQWEP